ncbi:MAG: hypothetical protein KatS3mg124_2385 [Porticoccaceae bacterium]|nr:MAG: hypothetical protein KatS3mg124_2385 [Porticoccaceae bacterium]
MDEFADIRPYRDEEVPEVVARLAADPQFAATLARLRHPWLARFALPLLVPLARRVVARRLEGVRTVHDLQMLVGVYLERMLAETGTDFSVSGIEHLERDQTYLFVSNHRDIAMDPAFVDLALHRHGFDTVRIAIGDNLLTVPWAADLMRLNKSFVVPRSASGRREKLAALQRLSRYIRKSILEDRCHVWIAQREGRAKDGVDRTDTAVIKMLGLARQRGESFAEAIDRLHLVPVAISYMWDPCDLDKARELHIRRQTGTYRKKPDEDLRSIYKGITGRKGAVHVAFGTRIAGLADDEAVAAEIDRQIAARYRLHPSNLLAWERLYGADPRLASLKAEFAGDWREIEAELERRAAGEEDAVRRILLAMYANPVSARLALAEGAAVG